MADINDKYPLHYAVRGYGTGQTVTVNVYDSLGNKEIDTGTMTELGSTGIYYYNWFPRKRTTYIAVMDCAARPRQQHMTIRIEKTKLAGAVTIPKVTPVFTPKVRDEITKQLMAIAKLQKLTQKNIEYIKTDRDHSALVEKTVKSADGRTLAVLSKGFLELKTDIKSQRLNEEQLMTQLNMLNEKLVKLSVLTDETNVNFQVTNEVFSTQFQSKLTNLIQLLDEFLIAQKDG